MDTIFEFIRRFLSGFVDQFKMKNPVAFTIIAVLLGAVYYIAGTMIDATLPDGSSLFSDQVDKVIETIRTIVVFALTLLGAHTPPTQKAVPRPEQPTKRAQTMYKG